MRLHAWPTTLHLIACLAVAAGASTAAAGPGPDFLAATPPAAGIDPSLAASSGTSTISPVDVVVFENNSAALLDSAQTQIAAAARWLRSNASYRILLEGHTNALGPVPTNEDLATRRAQAVRVELMRLGIPSDRIVLVIFGEAEATATNLPVERRVVLTAFDQPVRESVRQVLESRRALSAVWTDNGTMYEERRTPPAEPARRPPARRR